MVLGSLLSTISHLPFDRTIWSKLRTPGCIVLMVIKLIPNYYIRATYYSAVFFCILPELEEYVFMQVPLPLSPRAVPTLLEPPRHDQNLFNCLLQFILGFKGTQIVSGIIKAFMTMIKLWQCTVLSASPNCDVKGPGVGGFPWQADVCMVLYTQVLVCCIFELLSYCTPLGVPKVRRKKLVDKKVKAKSSKYIKLQEFDEENPYVPDDVLAGGRPKIFAKIFEWWDADFFVEQEHKTETRFMSLLSYDGFCTGAFTVACVGLALLDGWRADITFILIKILFMLSSAPFLLFSIPPIRKILARAKPTAFNRPPSPHPTPPLSPPYNPPTPPLHPPYTPPAPPLHLRRGRRLSLCLVPLSCPCHTRILPRTRKR